MVCGSMDIESHVQTRAMMHHDSELSFNFDICNNCGLVFLNPRVSHQELSAYYTKAYLPYRGPSAWGKHGNMVASSLKSTDKKRMAKLSSLDSESTILDIGCGQPSFLKTCYDKFNCRCIGIDFSDQGWKGNSEYDALDLHVGSLELLEQMPALDFITMWHYLEHDYDPRSTLMQLRKRASNNTRLLIEVPNFDSVSRRKYAEFWAGYHTPRHTFLFSPDNIERLLNETGWDVIDIDLKGTLDPYNLYWMSEMEQNDIDWRKDMEEEFWPYVIAMIQFRLKNVFNPTQNHGIMTITALCSD